MLLLLESQKNKLPRIIENHARKKKHNYNKKISEAATLTFDGIVAIDDLELSDHVCPTGNNSDSRCSYTCDGDI